MKKNILFFTILSTSLMGCPKSSSETSVQSNPSTESAEASGSEEAAELVCELNLQTIGLASIDKVFEDAKALDSKVCNLIDGLSSANKLITNLGALDSLGTEIAGMITSGAVTLSVSGGSPDFSFDDTKLEGRSKDIAGALDSLIGSIKQAKTDIPGFQTDLQNIVASAQAALGTLPTELKEAAASGSIKPTQIPKLLKSAKGNIGELGNIKTHLGMLQENIKESLTTITSLKK